jgi:hypothetical protein
VLSVAFTVVEEVGVSAAPELVVLVVVVVGATVDATVCEEVGSGVDVGVAVTLLPPLNQLKKAINAISNKIATNIIKKMIPVQGLYVLTPLGPIETP